MGDDNHCNKEKSLFKKLNCAIEGIIEVIRHEKNMRLHFFATVFVIVFSLFVGLSKIELAIITFAIALVWVTETINTAIEKVIDIYTKEYHELAKFAKDAASGAVFISAVTAVIIAYLVFYSHFEKIGTNAFTNAFKNLKTSYLHPSVIALILVMVIVIGLKAYFKKGTPLQGGMPSGHSAAAFSIMVSIFFISGNVYVAVLTLFLAVLVAQSRIKSGIHSLKEVIFGAIIGAGLTFLILIFFKSI